uniref:Putative secreted protein n=1 Tax=Ixodes ricinus TaxID=34613 RepID=A0A6B0V0Z2_IXORI
MPPVALVNAFVTVPRARAHLQLACLASYFVHAAKVVPKSAFATKRRRKSRSIMLSDVAIPAVERRSLEKEHEDVSDATVKLQNDPQPNGYLPNPPAALQQHSQDRGTGDGATLLRRRPTKMGDSFLLHGKCTGRRLLPSTVPSLQNRLGKMRMKTTIWRKTMQTIPSMSQIQQLHDLRMCSSKRFCSSCRRW